MAAPSVKPGARRRGRRGARRPVGRVHARRVPDPRPRARAGRGVRAGTTRAGRPSEWARGVPVRSGAVRREVLVEERVDDFEEHAALRAGKTSDAFESPWQTASTLALPGGVAVQDLSR